MIRNALMVLLVTLAAFSCARFDQRAERYDKTQCPICLAAAKGVCTYCSGTTKCMFCNGTAERTSVIPNRTDPGIQPGSFKSPCPYCSSTGVCQYCKKTGKCWACEGTGRVSDNWEFLNSRTAAVTEPAK